MNKIAILDAGSQYGKLIDRTIRELNCETEIFPLTVDITEISDYAGIIISGSPDSVYDSNSIKCDPNLFELNIPILGICYGFQLMNYLSGGTIVKNPIREDGQIMIAIDTTSVLFKDLDENQNVLLTHGDSVDIIAADYKIIARSPNSIAGIEHISKQIYGLQFHPEVDLTENGSSIFKNFLFNICKLTPTFTLDNRLNSMIDDIRSHVKTKKVIMLVSGGVDSSVCLALLCKALDHNQIHAVHIDTGFLRKCDQHVIDHMNKLGFNITVINAKNDFYNGQTMIDGVMSDKLCNTVEPESKRKIIGDTFMKVIDKHFDELQLKSEDCLLVQGTLRPDLIESASKLASNKADTIKTHHNDTKLVREMRDKGLILEPLKDLHKNEVRRLGIELGLEHDMVYRHPFPGPGLAIRTICTPLLDSRCRADFEDVKIELARYETGEYGLELLPIKTVGIQGDCRTYSYICSITGPYTDDLYRLAREIPQKVKGINRVIYNTGTHGLSLIELSLTEDNMNLLRDVDELLNDVFKPLYSQISQMPIILLPIGLEGKKSIVLRPIMTNDFMTALPYRIPLEYLITTQNVLKSFDAISNLFVDLTSKPPGTIEYE